MGSVGASNGQSGLSVIIVGAGISGLAAATAIAQKGHSVTVLESKPSLNEFGASIGILANGVLPLKAWGLEEDFKKVVTVNGKLDIRDGATNEPLGYIAMNENEYAETIWGTESWNINRKDYQAVLAKGAQSYGAKIIFDAEVTKVDVDNCTVHLKDGREMTADVVIGADGMRSNVRYSIPATAHIEPKALEEACFRCEVPKESMRGNPQIEWLLHNQNEMCWSSPGKYVLSWPLPEFRAYDVVTCVQRPSDVPPGRWGVRTTPEEARAEFGEFCPEVRELLSHMHSAVKWTLAELPPLETCRSENGRVVLIGDAFHAQIPHSASGGNSAIEDAACIAECLDWSYRNDRPLSTATQAFEDIRKPRVERMQKASQEGYDFLGAKGDFRPIRDDMLREAAKHNDKELAVPPEERRARKRPEPDMHARFPTDPYLSWLYGYDAIEVAREHLAALG